MKLWLISQEENTGYDTYSDVVVAAETAEEARRIPPDKFYYAWASKPENVSVRLLGEALEGIKAGVILASYHAG